ncbi:helix-turn-helix domain-containing protein [Blastococcus brunescens]|uniref:Helix-turn-helix domain-containing protein n=1 Tax=Blastococcus brunescens TaxID=1564165 RepID=A0ABZ1AZW2_9ACTN|nr:helix-turn-helix domain-containing protein [Blastococcus sp. BMG 8361]WRL62599.1 helix-turn-helix domain-containing protein [Blastococcus sp. BMG 8361]
MGQPNPVAVLDKAVTILRAVADEPATLAELVSRTGLPRATAHRLAVALEGTASSGAPRRAPGLPGRPWSSSAAAVPTSPIWPDGTWSSCATPAGERPVLRPRRRNARLRRRGRAHQRAARHRPRRRAAAHDGGVGRSCAARLHAGRRGHPPAAVGQLHRPDPARRPPARLGAQRGRTRAGVASLSAPVRDGSGTVLGAVSISGPVERLGRRPSPEIVGAVLDAAAAISRAAR